VKYSVLILPRAQRELTALQKKDYEKVKAAILALADNPRRANCQKLTGRIGWRIRVGDYRVVYEVDDSVRSVTVLNVGHRREIYR
jgi:mRNA interferase RelE/StbE